MDCIYSSDGYTYDFPPQILEFVHHIGLGHWNNLNSDFINFIDLLDLALHGVNNFVHNIFDSEVKLKLFNLLSTQNQI